MPQLPLWKAVALLCEIEPSSLPKSDVIWRLAPSCTPSATFNVRFQVAVEHHRSGALACQAPLRGFHTDLVVRVNAFAEWVAGMGWELPAELRAGWRASASVAVESEPDSSRQDAPSGDFPSEQAERVRELEQAEVQRQEAVRLKAQQASSARWSKLKSHKARAWELATSKAFKSRTAEFARDRIEKNAEGDLYAVETVEDWLRAGGWQRLPQ